MEKETEEALAIEISGELLAITRKMHRLTKVGAQAVEAMLLCMSVQARILNAYQPSPQAEKFIKSLDDLRAKLPFMGAH